ncbi:DUF5522 domain-containing protein [Qipengyuania sp. S6317L1]|uniref:DUF5522 domain-containing protein n=1 Tax=Qipengyuania sp. S6317L1 TaxID=2926410 RepID=UPI001FF44F40|nr:DUF5522 domain-containing protein [Qipengyuania sp. S6317L1]MCK0098637.1 DUF5522 domain-containing protein [Qipengyuania sp. S6317L1]
MTQPPFWTLHEEACARGETVYIDPQTGFTVFTRLGLLARERCCGAGCRHCPFGHESVPVERRASRIQQPAWLSELRPDPSQTPAVLFWRGGKDSFLALRSVEREGAFAPVLLTTFDPATRTLAGQGLSVADVVDQAQNLGLGLIGVPLHDGVDYAAQIVPAFDLIPDARHVFFPDLGLEPIRQWREATFAGNPETAPMTLHFPLWGEDYNALLADLEASGAKCEVSAVTGSVSGMEVGSPFNAQLCERLPDAVDAFGLNGEFRTRMVFEMRTVTEPN